MLDLLNDCLILPSLAKLNPVGNSVVVVTRRLVCCIALRCTLDFLTSREARSPVSFEQYESPAERQQAPSARAWSPRRAHRMFELPLGIVVK